MKINRTLIIRLMEILVNNQNKQKFIMRLNKYDYNFYDFVQILLMFNLLLSWYKKTFFFSKLINYTLLAIL